MLANYIDYDFESEVEQTRSFVFRNFVADDSLSWNISSHSNIKAHLRLLFEETGRLLWSEWAERPLMSRASLWTRLLWQYHISPGVSVSSGIMYYKRNGWRFTNITDGQLIREKNETYVSWGPILKIEYSPSNKLKIGFRGIRQQVEPMKSDKYYLNNLDLHLNWFF